MDKIYSFDDFNGVDGGSLEPFSNGEDHLLMIVPEHGELVSVYVKKEQLQFMADLVEGE